MLHGREHEVAQLDALVEGARAGRAGVLMVVGPPGQGKSALLDDLVGRVPDLTVVRLRGSQSDWAAAFGGVADAIRSLEGASDLLSARSRRTLDAVSALEPDADLATEPVALALLHLLAAASQVQPVLLVIDDLQWLDPSSRTALSFAVRRLVAERIAVVVTRRPPSGADELSRLPRLDLAPLADAAARALVLDHAPSGAAPELVELAVRTGQGNPLGLVELTRSLSAPQWRGEAAVPDPIPIDAGYLFEQRLDDLGPAAMDTLGIAAIDPFGDLDVVRRVVVNLDLDPDALAVAERQGLVTLGGGRVGFVHPLMRSTASHRLRRDLRAAGHREIAHELPVEQVERRAWHLAAGTDGRDDTVADLLDQAGQVAAARGDDDAASLAFERSARSTDDPSARHRRLLRAAWHAAVCGKDHQVEALAREVGSETGDDTTRASARLLLSRALGHTKGAPAAAHELDRALAEIGAASASVTAELTLEAAELAIRTNAPRAAKLAGRARALAEADDDARLVLRADLASSTASVLAGRRDEGDELVARLRAAIDRGVELGRIAPVMAAVVTALNAQGRSQEAIVILETMTVAARQQQAVGVLPELLFAQAEIEMLLGQFTPSWTHASEAAELADQLGRTAMFRVIAGRLAGAEAMRGNLPRARELFEQVIDGADQFDHGSIQAHRGLAVLDLYSGDPYAAVGHLERIDGYLATIGRPDLALGIYEHDLVEAYLAVGKRAEAEAVAARFAPLAQSSGLAFAEAVVVHIDALLADERHFDECFAAAAVAARPFTFLRARCLTAWAERLETAGERDRAAALLREAAGAAQAVGATAIVRYAQRRLAEPHGRDDDPGDLLTADEHQIATQFVAGASLDEVASSVFRSTDSTASILRSALSKTRSASLQDLGGMLASPPPEDAPQPGWDVTLLGSFAVRHDGRLVPDVPGIGGQAVRLTAVRGELPTEELIEALWPDVSPESGRVRLRNVLSRVRSAVGEVIERRGDTVGLAGDAQVDARRFEREVDEALRAKDMVLARTALGRYAGDLLPDSPYAEWAAGPRERLRRRYVAVLDLLAEDAAAAGEIDAAASLLERAADATPYDDGRLLQAAELFFGVGRHGAAAAMVQRAGAASSALGLAPSPRAIDLERRIRGA